MHNTTSAHQKHRFHDHAKAPVRPADDDDDDVFVVVVAVVVPEDNAPRQLLGLHIVSSCSIREYARANKRKSQWRLQSK